MIGLAVAAAYSRGRSTVVFLLGLYGFLLPFDTVLVMAQVSGIHIHVTWAVGALATAAMVWSGIMRNRLSAPPRAAIWIVLLVFWALMSGLWSISTQQSIFRLPVLALMLALYLAAVSYRATGKELDAIVHLVIAGGLLAAAFGLYGYLHGHSWTPPEFPHLGRQLPGRETLSSGDRITDPNILGATLILPLTLAIGRLLSTRTTKQRVMLLGTVVAIAFGIVATMSRGSIAAVGALLVVFLIRSRVTWRIALPVGVIIATLWILPGMFARFNTADRGAGRLDIWIVGLHALPTYGLLGAGLDTFPTVYDQFAQHATKFVGLARAPHNIYLGAAVELGIFGVVLVILLARQHLRLARKTAQRSYDKHVRFQVISLEAALWGLLVCALFLDVLWEEYLWLNLMLIIFAARVVEAQRKPVTTHVELYSSLQMSNTAS